MAAPTITIEPEELLGLSALAELDLAAPGAAANQSPTRTRYSCDMRDKVQVGLG